MEKTMARAIYKKMEIGKAYTTGEMFQTSRANYSLGLNAYKAECNGQKLGR